MQKLPEAELEIMLAMWQATEQVPRTYFDRKLAHRKWNTNTINTLLSRLQEKGFLAAERKGRENLYHALIGQDAYREFESSTILEKLYGNSIKNFVLSLAHTDALEEEDIEELQQYLTRLQKGDSND